MATISSTSEESAADGREGFSLEGHTWVIGTRVCSGSTFLLPERGIPSKSSGKKQYSTGTLTLQQPLL